MKENNLFLGHMEDLARKAERNRMAYSTFLTLEEAGEASERFANRSGVNLIFDGGFRYAERMVAVFTAQNVSSYDRSTVVTALALHYRACEKDRIGHRDILGAVLALGIKREVIGDIYTKDNPAILICLTQMKDFLITHFEKVGRVSINTQAMSLADLPENEPDILEKKVTLASLRLDAVISAAFQLSRSNAAQSIRNGLVQLKHRECLNPAETVDSGAIFSLKGYGRAKLLEVGGLSKKGRKRVLLGIYKC